MPSKEMLELEKDIGCGFDLSITPMSNQRFVINEQWTGFSDELLDRPINRKLICIVKFYNLLHIIYKKYLIRTNQNFIGWIQKFWKINNDALFDK